MRNLINNDLTRQRKWQLKQVAEGRCSKCGAIRPAELKNLCRKCQDKANEIHARYVAKRRERGS